MAKAKENKLKVTLVKSPISSQKDQQATIVALGLRKMWQTVEKPDNACVRGQIFKVKHLVKVVGSDDPGAPRKGGVK